jgi:putative AbiEii toxin of type IV toxin-antitoxin system/AAA ATPase-like protein
MLTRLQIQNFKTFGEQVEIDLRPLTVLTGANGVGKSSALESIALFAQSTPVPEQAPQFRWSDRFVDLGANGQAAFHKPDHDLHLVLGMEIEAGENLRAWLRKHNFDADLRAEMIGYTVEHRRGTEEWKHHLHLDGELIATNATVPVGRGPIKKGHGAFLEYHSRSALERMFTPAVSGNAVLAPKLFMGMRAIGGNEVDEATQHTFVGFGLYMSFLIACLKQKVFMLGPSRMPVREAPQPDAGPLNVGRRGERTIAVLSVLFAHPRHLTQARQIQHWAQIFGMESLTSGWVREELLHAGYLDPDFDSPLGFESAGCGAQQVLPIITQIFAAPRNSLILIEEPEAGLHPESQAHLARMFAEAVRLGHQLIITTHSEALLEGLQEQFGATADSSEIAIYLLKKTQLGTRLQTYSYSHESPDDSVDPRVPSIEQARKAHA